MCVECCWCLCIHKVSFRGAGYFFASVHSYDGVSKLLSLVFKNVLLRTYFMDTHKTDLDMPDSPIDAIDLLAKSLYYLATTVTALLLFRAIEKEWRHLIQWGAVMFLTIEALALSMYFVLNPNSLDSVSSLLTISSRCVFVFFYIVSLVLYIRQLLREEAEVGWKFQQDDWKPKFLCGASPGGIWNGQFGTLGFGDNTKKWLEKDFNSVIVNNNCTGGSGNGINRIPSLLRLDPLPLGNFENTYLKKTQHNIDNAADEEKFEVRYEVCKSSGKM